MLQDKDIHINIKKAAEHLLEAQDILYRIITNEDKFKEFKDDYQKQIKETFTYLLNKPLDNKSKPTNNCGFKIDN